MSKNNKKQTANGSTFAVRLLCIILAGLMVLGAITTLLVYLFN